MHPTPTSCETDWEAGAESREQLAILRKLLFNLSGSLVQVQTLKREKSLFQSACRTT